jgi:hypothetical protein
MWLDYPGHHFVNSIAFMQAVTSVRAGHQHSFLEGEGGKLCVLNRLVVTIATPLLGALGCCVSVDIAPGTQATQAYRTCTPGICRVH